MMSQITAVKRTFEQMETTPLIGGFEDNLAEKITTGTDDKKYLKDIELQQSRPFRRRNVQSFSELRKRILVSIRSFLDERFEADETLLQLISPFIDFNPDANIRAVHEKVAPDLSLPSLSLQFQDISNNPDVLSSELSLNEKIVQLSKTTESRENFRELIIVLARFAACTPHSADVERCISSNNRLKTKLRSSLAVETENKYLFIHYNMPNLENWNPTAAANLFVTEKARRERDTTTAAGGKPREQTYFKGVFAEAGKLVDPDTDAEKAIGGHKEFSNKFFDF